MKMGKKKAAAAGVSAVLTVSLVVGGVCEAPGVTMAAETEAETVKGTEAQAAQGKGADAVTKEETVYVMLDESGQTQEVIVSDWLKNAGIGTTLSDVSDLSDIENTKGDEAYTREGDTLLWDAAEDDIYYQGTGSTDLPIGITISYKLDGKKIEPQELAGKSGALEMTIQYENHSKTTVQVNGREREVYTPFAVATALLLPVESFTAVTVDQGTILSEGKNTVVIAYGMPGLKENLGLEDLDWGEDLSFDWDSLTENLSDTVTITAQVEDFSMGRTYSVATAELFEDFTLETDSADELEEKLDELTDGTQQLVDGADSLAEGSSDFDDAVQEYTGAADTLLDGVTAYADGAKSFAKSTKSYSKNAKKLIDGVGKLYTASKKFPQSYEEFATQLDAYTEGVNTLLSEENMESLSDAVDTLKEGVETVDGGLQSVQSGVASISKGAQALDAQSENADACILALQNLQSRYEALADAAADDETKAQYEALAKALAGSISYMQGAEELAASVSAATNGTADGEADGDGSQDLAAALAQIEAAVNTKSETQNIYTGLDALSDSVDTIAANAETLRGYRTPLLEGSNTVQESISSIVKNLKTIYKKGTRLTSNNEALNDAADTISENAGTITKNSGKLTDAGTALRKAAKQVANGAKKLYDGIKTFQKDGTGAIVDTVNTLFDSGSDLQDNMEAISSAAKAYQSFSGISDSMDGSVKFVLTTEEITAED